MLTEPRRGFVILLAVLVAGCGDNRPFVESPRMAEIPSASVKRLVDLLSDADERVADAAFRELQDRYPMTMDEVGDSIGRGTTNARKCALLIIGGYGTRAARFSEAVIGEIDHPDADVQARALRAALRISPSGPRAVDLLERGLASSHSQVRQSAWSCALELGMDAVPVLRRAMLGEAGPETQRAAGTACGLILSKVGTRLGSEYRSRVIKLVLEFVSAAGRDIEAQERLKIHLQGLRQFGYLPEED